MRRKINAVLAAAPLLCLGTVGTNAAAGAPPPAPCANADLSPTSGNAASVDAATLCLINEVRTAHRLHALHANGELRMLATSQVHAMVRWDYFADNRPPGVTPMALIGSTRYPKHTRSLSIGQNIGWGTGAYATPISMVAAWMASPPHRRVILTSEYREAGAGVTAAVPPVLEPEFPGATYAIEFAARRF
jgi:uncharacterized protein YkwD